MHCCPLQIKNIADTTSLLLIPTLSNSAWWSWQETVTPPGTTQSNSGKWSTTTVWRTLLTKSHVLCWETHWNASLAQLATTHVHNVKPLQYLHPVLLHFSFGSATAWVWNTLTLALATAGGHMSVNQSVQSVAPWSSNGQTNLQCTLHTLGHYLQQPLFIVRVLLGGLTGYPGSPPATTQNHANWQSQQPSGQSAEPLFDCHWVAGDNQSFPRTMHCARVHSCPVTCSQDALTHT